jgi:hypothetical protein
MATTYPYPASPTTGQTQALTGGVVMTWDGKSWNRNQYGPSYGTAVRTIPTNLVFSATPAFDPTASNVIYFGALTANVTAVSVPSGLDGQTINIRFTQDATGGRTVVLGTGFKVTGSVQLTANLTTWLVVTWVASATRWEGSWSNIPA